MRGLRNTLFCLTFILIYYSYLSATCYIIVPGTWAAKSTWYLPGGDFYDALQKQISSADQLVAYMWSGENNHQSRVTAAQNLASLLESCSEPILITHSHGTNVAILASQELAKRGIFSKIQVLYALAAPVSEEDYAPNMDVINYFYNLFSFEDVIQPVMGAFGREFSIHERRANIRITINGKAPVHTTIHHVTVAQWLPRLHTHLTNQPTFDFTQPGIVHLHSKKLPEYMIDTDREQQKELDRWYQSQLAYAFNRTRHEK